MPARRAERPRESVVQSGVLAALRRAGGWAVNIHGEPLQPKTIDIIACVPTEYRLFGKGWPVITVGVTLGIECKRRGTGYTRAGTRLISNDPLQEHELQDIRDAGGWAAVVDDPAIVKQALAVWPHVCRMCLHPHESGRCND